MQRDNCGKDSELCHNLATIIVFDVEKFQRGPRILLEIAISRIPFYQSPQKSRRTLIVYCILCSLNVLFKSVLGPIGPIPLLAIMCFFNFFYTTM